MPEVTSLHSDLSKHQMSSNTGYWDYGGDREPLMHRIHAYPAKFPAFITQKAVAYAKERGVTVERIADIFCGCGTTALEAKRLNTAFWGCDINPVATLIARVKRSDYQVAHVEQELDTILRAYARRNRLRNTPYLQDERLRYWYDDTRILSLSRLKAAIETIPSGKYRDFFLCAFSNILKSTSRWLTKSIKPQIDPNKKPLDVLSAFKKQVAMMVKALEEDRDLGSRDIDSEIVTGNFLEMDFLEPLADLIVTSPPYVTSYEYADLHQLSTLWLNFTDDYRKLRTGTIGSLYHESSFERDVLQINNVGSDIVFRLYNTEKRKARATAKYFIDLKRTVHQCKKLLRSGGMILFVIGNTEYKGVKIDNADYLKNCLAAEGFVTIETAIRKISSKILTPYRNALGQFSTDATSRKVYAEEFIITGRIA